MRTRLIAIAGLAVWSFLVGMSPVAADTVNFQRNILPILLRHCSQCHGAAEQESGLRLDGGRWARRGGDRGSAVVPGKSSESLIYQAITGHGDTPSMPPEGPQLSPDQIRLIQRWIDDGAHLPADEPAIAVRVESEHWAFQPIRLPPIPTVGQTEWIRNPIDAFVLDRLEAEGLSPSPEADRTTLIRRLSLDLRGTLPTIGELDRYLSDQRPGAYERLVERMFASPRYGERWGRHWLDAARYADSNGFTKDGERSIWKYRDWVIKAWNRDLPFDRFTTEQLAGDLLAGATREQIIATGFHRNTLINEEGGTDDEQFRVESIVDRVNTTGSVFLGLTIGCAQCHAHKYDPITQREFYEMYALFNNCDEPTFPIPTPQQATALQNLDVDIQNLEETLATEDAQLMRGFDAWEKALSGLPLPTWTTLNPTQMKAEQGTVLILLDDQSVFVDSNPSSRDTYTITADVNMERITGVRLEALTHPELPEMGPGLANDGNFVLSEFELLVAPQTSEPRAKHEPQARAFTRAVADHSGAGNDVQNSIDGDQTTGWSVAVKEGNLNVHREAVFVVAEPTEHQTGSELVIKLHQNHSEADYLLGRFRLSVTCTPPDALEVLPNVRTILATAAQERSSDQQQLLTTTYLATSHKRRSLTKELEERRTERERLMKTIPTTMVLRSRQEPRQTHIHIRGDFLRKGAAVQGGVPAVLPELAVSDATATRLDLARWLVDPANPLTARVTVNRFWQRLLGKGLVETENDFGTQGTPPTHAELLDWLADEFIRLDWSMKSLQRVVVTSATYRQSSAVRGKLLQRDTGNYLMARQVRLRVEAETVRDICLSASGLLSSKMYGPGVYPPQPQGIYRFTQRKKSWPESPGESRYRRGMYTFFWRSSPYPFLPTFDAPDANTTCTRRTRSNTPLQALTLANDTVFFEMAQGLALRILTQGPSELRSRIRFVFRLCLSRSAQDPELEHLVRFFTHQYEHFQSNPELAQAVVPVNCPPHIPHADAAAWTAVARVMLNLDEFITRE
jgi:hypothetical protein